MGKLTVGRYSEIQRAIDRCKRKTKIGYECECIPFYLMRDEFFMLDIKEDEVKEYFEILGTMDKCAIVYMLQEVFHPSEQSYENDLYLKKITAE